MRIALAREPPTVVARLDGDILGVTRPRARGVWTLEPPAQDPPPPSRKISCASFTPSRAYAGEVSASRIGALAILTVASTTLAAVLLTAAAVVLRVVGGSDAASGSQWHELRLAVLPLAPAIVLALGTRIAPTRPGVGPGAVVFAIAAALLTLAYFRLTPEQSTADNAVLWLFCDGCRKAVAPNDADATWSPCAHCGRAVHEVCARDHEMTHVTTSAYR